jgi:outer membrane protein OmpA-like peptidoglycan-associated protein/tetratricopeptide (TPR) repeat protein
MTIAFTASSQKPKKIEKSAQELLHAEEYYDALKLYLKLDSLVPNKASTNYDIGICYMHSNTKTKALPYFKKAKELNSDRQDLDFYLGRSYHLNHKFDEAEVYYKSYKEIMKDSSRIIADMDRHLEMCNVGRKLMADSSELVIENLGPDMNSPYPDYVPTISADETVMIFTSRREGTTGGNQDSRDGLYFEDLYISYKDANGWSKPANMGTSVNTKLHDACIGLSPDGHKLFIYRSHPGKYNSGDIYVSNLEGDKWSSPIAMSSPINSDSWEPSATITADEKTIYFISDRKGGLGGTDIYYSKLQENGQWGEAINMGPTINTEYDEDGPYIHPDGKTLYFSSKGNKTMGGFDIFSSQYNSEKNEWSTPVNAGYPINTADDDIYFVWSADGTKGYFSSYRSDSYGDKDLYVIHGPKKGTTNLVVLKGKIINAETNEPIASTITLTDNETNKIVGVYNSNSLTGKYIVVLPHGKDYNISIQAEGYVFQSENIHVEAHSPFFEKVKDISLGSVKVGNKIVLKNIFFDLNKATLRSTSTTELEKLYTFMVEQPDLKIEISGHTDSLGKDKSNQVLSASRANAVVNYLTQKGINKNRMVAKGYASKMPIATNETEEGRQLNRRTEFKIIGGSASSMQVVYEMYDENIKQANNATTKLPKEDKVNTSNTSIQDKVALNNTTSNLTSKTTATDTTAQGSNTNYNFTPGYILKAKVHFIYNISESLTEYSRQRVDYVIDLMKQYPSLKIKIHAHADHFGNSEYNKQLSQKRAQTVLKYMTSKGIAKDRLDVAAFGAEKEIVKSDVKEDNLLNRRVEFEVMEF